MNMDHGYQDISHSNILSLDDSLPNDYFYSTEYDYLTIHEVQLLLTLSDSQISYSFSGLRKKTTLHQHKLTKALRRLQEREFLIKNESGSYELTYNGSIYTRKLLQDLLNKNAINKNEDILNSSEKMLKLIPPIDREEISSLLEKRWFSDFRFLYKREINDLIELCWEDDNQNQCRLYINQISEIKVEYRSSNLHISDLESLTGWIIDEIKNHYDTNIQIDDEETEMPYN